MKRNQLSAYFWNIDPGYFRLKHATKTVLAILISLWLMRDEAVVTQLMTCTACGFSMQGVVATSFTSRLMQLALFDLGYFSSFALGLFVRESPRVTALTLVILAFVVNYLRRFGLEKSKAPMMAWTLCFLATSLPFADLEQAWAHIYGVLVGIFVAAGIILVVFPDRYHQLFVSNSNRFFDTLAEGLRDLRIQLLRPDQQSSFSHLPFVQVKALLDNLLDSNQAMQQRVAFGSQQDHINAILVHQYALLNAYALMIDAYHKIWNTKQCLSRPAKMALSRLCKQSAQTFSDLQLSSDYGIILAHPLIRLTHLGGYFSRIPLTHPAMVMALLNFKLAFDVLNQHVVAWVRQTDET